MSVFEYTSGFLSLGPRVWQEGDSLFLRTPFLGRLLTAFSYCRTVEIDARQRTVTISRSRFWAFPIETYIAFSEIAYLDYDFSRAVTNFSWWMGATDQLESFAVTFVLHEDERRVPVARFVGEGSVATGLEGVFIGGDEFVDLRGAQEDGSRALVEKLAEIIGVTLGPPIEYVGSSTGTLGECSDCGRPSPSTRRTCQYCGGDVVRAEDT